jgi:hypothetical protein
MDVWYDAEIDKILIFPPDLKLLINVIGWTGFFYLGKL